MAGYFVLGVLAAFGLLCALWAMFGWLLPGAEGCTVVCCGVLQPEQLSRFQWLRSLGFLDCPVILVSDVDISGAETCNEEELLLRLKQEYERYYGTGTGDPPGRSQRCGLSEL